MDKSTKLARIILWILMGISVALCVLLMTSIESQTIPGVKAERLISLSLNWAIFLTVVAGLLALTFAMIQILGDKKRAIISLVYILGFALIIIVSYALSSSDIPQFFGVEIFISKGILTPSISRWIGAGLISTYILFTAAALSVAWFGAANMFKRS